MRRSLPRLLTAAVAATLVSLGVAGPASATTLDVFTLSPAATTPGTTVTVTASWISDQALPGGTDLSISLPSALVGVATWGTPTLTPDRSSQLCVVDSDPSGSANPLSVAACLWRPAAADETATMTAELTLPADVPPGTYDLTAKETSSAAQSATLTVLSDATPAIALSTSSTPPGSTVAATGTFTALTNGDITVTVDLMGTGGNGTFGTPTSTTGLTGCVMDASLRSYTCTWAGAVVGETRSIVIPVQVAAGTPAGSTFTVEAVSNKNTAAADAASTVLSIESAATQTPTPTPTATPTATATPTPTASASPSKTSNGSVSGDSDSSGSGSTALPTAVPAGEGPAPTGSGSAPGAWIWLGVFSVFVAAAGLALRGVRSAAP